MHPTKVSIHILLLLIEVSYLIHFFNKAVVLVSPRYIILFLIRYYNHMCLILFLPVNQLHENPLLFSYFSRVLTGSGQSPTLISHILNGLIQNFN